MTAPPSFRKKWLALPIVAVGLAFVTLFLGQAQTASLADNRAERLAQPALERPPKSAPRESGGNATYAASDEELIISTEGESTDPLDDLGGAEPGEAPTVEAIEPEQFDPSPADIETESAAPMVGEDE